MSENITFSSHLSIFCCLCNKYSFQKYAKVFSQGCAWQLLKGRRKRFPDVLSFIKSWSKTAWSHWSRSMARVLNGFRLDWDQNTVAQIHEGDRRAHNAMTAPEEGLLCKNRESHSLFVPEGKGWSKEITYCLTIKHKNTSRAKVKRNISMHS